MKGMNFAEIYLTVGHDITFQLLLMTKKMSGLKTKIYDIETVIKYFNYLAYLDEPKRFSD